ncbi:MAG: carbohydrate binding domain-containing protein [Sedimentisphaerales bacterium]
MYKRRFYLTCFVFMLFAVPLVTHAQVENLALNPSFEEDEVILDDPEWLQWATWGYESGLDSTVEIDETEFIDGKRSLRVIPTGDTNWYFIVLNLPIYVDIDKDYTISFWAKAEEPRPLTVQLKATDNSINAWGATDFELTTEWAEYHYTSEVLIDDVKLEILCSGSEAPFWLDFVYVYEGDYVAGIGPVPPLKASEPDPADGAFLDQTWATLSWIPGELAVSHDVYMGDNFNDVNESAGDTFRINQVDDFYVAGFPGFAYPDGLVNGTTYYWRIDEVNNADPNSPWKGNVWSFTVTPQTAYIPDPADGAEFIDLNVQLTWTAGFGAKLHYIVFGDDFDAVNNATDGLPQGLASYTPDSLKFAKTYYWRVDEFDGIETYKGEIWSFTTEGAVSGPNPANGAVGVKPSVTLRWDAGAVAASHEVYFGTDADVVKNATKTSPEYKGPKALGEESHDPGELTLSTTYYWRIDEVNGVNPDSPWAGNVWSFMTSDYFVIDDFEDYDAGENQIWFTWHDGLGYGTPGTADYFAGNGTGAAVGDENTSSYTEETIVHGGNQSMPIAYDNNKQGYSKSSEVEHTLADQRDWTEEGVAELSLWFRGYPASVSSFVEGSVGTYTMTGSGADIWDQSDEFHYAFKTLSGSGSIVARVESVSDTDPWAKAGVMIRETLDADSTHAMMVVTPGSGVSFQRRIETSGDSANDDTVGITAPSWVKIERGLAGTFTAYCSANGSTWQKLGVSESIQMGTNVYIGLAVTAHNAGATCEGVFSNVTITGTAGTQWANQDIGIVSNAPEPLYVALSNSSGTPAVVYHKDPAAANIDTWTEWVIPLQAIADQGINLSNVDRIAIGLGTQGNMTIPGGSGKMFFDDIRLYHPRQTAEECASSPLGMKAFFTLSEVEGRGLCR